MKAVKHKKYVYKIKTGNNLNEFLLCRDNYLIISNSNYAKLEINFDKLSEVVPIFTKRKYNFINFCINKGCQKVFLF